MSKFKLQSLCHPLSPRGLNLNTHTYTHTFKPVLRLESPPPTVSCPQNPPPPSLVPASVYAFDQILFLLFLGEASAAVVRSKDKVLVTKDDKILFVRLYVCWEEEGSCRNTKRKLWGWRKEREMLHNSQQRRILKIQSGNNKYEVRQIAAEVRMSQASKIWKSNLNVLFPRESFCKTGQKAQLKKQNKPVQQVVAGQLQPCIFTFSNF